MDRKGENFREEHKFNRTNVEKGAEGQKDKKDRMILKKHISSEGQ